MAILHGQNNKNAANFMQDAKEAANRIKTLVDQGLLSDEEGVRAVNRIQEVNTCALKVLESSQNSNNVENSSKRSWVTRERMDKVGPASEPKAHRIDVEEIIYIEGPFDTAARLVGLTELPILAKGLLATAQYSIFQFLANSIASSTYVKVTRTFQDVQKFHFRLTVWEENIQTGERAQLAKGRLF